MYIHGRYLHFMCTICKIYTGNEKKGYEQIFRTDSKIKS